MPVDSVLADADNADTMAHDSTPLRFVLVPKVAHPWYEEVHRGAREQAQFLEKQTGRKIVVEHRPPSVAGVAEQDAMLAAVLATAPAGIALDPVDTLAHLPALAVARQRSIPVLVFDAPSSNPNVCSVGNDFAEQGAMAARRLVQRIGGSGKVAVMQGVPTAPNHRERHRAQLRVLQEHPAITVVDGGTDNDDIPTAKQQAAAVLAAHPDLVGYLCCDASGPIGIAAAIREAGRVGKVTFVSMDGIEPILREVKAGVIDASAATIPDLQGSMALLMLWQASQGMRIPQKIDTGIDLITADNVDRFLAAVRGPAPR